MQFRSIADLHRAVMAGIGKLPRDIDVVVGVPRSGMLPATFLSLALNLPLAELHSFVQGRLLSTGNTRRGPKADMRFEDIRNVLVIDDSIYEGAAMAEARTLMAPLETRFRITYCAVYGAKSSSAADIILETVPIPRVFEWNVLHHSMLQRACVDIDG